MRVGGDLMPPCIFILHVWSAGDGVSPAGLRADEQIPVRKGMISY
jgi:hypothetical protein